MAQVSLDDLTEALEMVASGESCGIETLAYVCLKTGKVWVTGSDDDLCEDEGLPSDLSDNEQYVMAPDKSELDLGRDLALSFIEQSLPQQLDRAYGFFRRKGAYGQFKRLLSQHELMDDWYDFEQQHIKLALKRWCESHHLVLA